MRRCDAWLWNATVGVVRNADRSRIWTFTIGNGEAPSVTTRKATSSRFVGNAIKLCTGPHFLTIDDHQSQQGSFVSLRSPWEAASYGSAVSTQPFRRWTKRRHSPEIRKKQFTVTAC